MAVLRKTQIVGIAGGSGSGKTMLADYLYRGLKGRAVLISHDWYYRDCSHLSPAEKLKVNVDHPGALETPLLVRHLHELKAQRPVDTPRYDYATQSRLPGKVPVSPAEIILLEGLFILHEDRLRPLLDLRVFVDVPADIRLLRRIRRDTEKRGISLEETLDRYEHYVRPMHERYVQPSAMHANRLWMPLTTPKFPRKLLLELNQLLK
jgi:uridine kinase